MMLLAFYKGRARIGNRLIADLTDGPYSHVEVILETGKDGWALCLSSSMMDGGVRVKLINTASANWDIVTVRTSMTTDDAWAWFHAHSNAKYDYAGALRYRLPLLKQNPRKKYCSEVVCEILKMDRSYHPNGLFKSLTV